MFKFILLFAVMASNVSAWTVSPMSKDLAATERSYQLKIDNKGGKVPVAVRLTSFERNVDNLGGDKLNKTKDIIVFPKQMIVQPGKVAVARVSIRKPNIGAIEKAYRVVIDQVPVRKADEKRGIKVLTRYLTSVYLKPKAAATENFSFTGGSVDNKAITLSAVNNGNVHKVILPSNIVITKDTGEQVSVDKKFEVVNVLPHKTIDMVLPISSDTLNGAQSIHFSNTCVTCKDEEYEVVLSK